jgi:hypothetical protein
MNEYFKRTPDSFNYDGAQHPGEGNLYDLRVATRDALQGLEDKFSVSTGAGIQIRGMVDWIDELENRIAELERITKIQAADIQYNDERKGVDK